MILTYKSIEKSINIITSNKKLEKNKIIYITIYYIMFFNVASNNQASIFNKHLTIKVPQPRNFLIISMSIFFHHAFKDFTISRRCKGNCIRTCLDHFSYCFFCWSSCSYNWKFRTYFS